MASKPEFYAVKKGCNPGIYTTWKDCNDQVQGFKRCDHKSFTSRAEAEQYMLGVSAITSGSTMLHVQALSKSSMNSPKVVDVKRIGLSHQDQVGCPQQLRYASALFDADKT